MLLDVVDAVDSVLRPEEGSWTGAAENGGVGNKEGRGSLGEYGVLWSGSPWSRGSGAQEKSMGPEVRGSHLDSGWWGLETNDFQEYSENDLKAYFPNKPKRQSMEAEASGGRGIRH